MAIMCSGRKCSVSITVFFFIILVAAMWLVWFGAGSLLGKPEVENFLQRLSAQLADTGNKYGKNIKLTYGNIDLEGWGHEKKAIVHNIALEVSPKDSAFPVKFALAVDDVTVSTDPYDFQKLLIKISKPINVLQNGTVINTVVSSEPVLYRYMLAQASGIEAFHHDFVLPKHISFMATALAIEGKDNNQAGQEQVALDFISNPVINFMTIPNRNTDSLNYDLSGVTLTVAGQKKISIGMLKSQNNEEPGDEEGRIAGKYNMEANNIVLYKDQDSTRPYALNVDTNTTADIIQARDADEPKTSGAPQDAMATPGYENARRGAMRNREVVLNDFSISSTDFIVRAKGSFANIKGDPLPSGEVNFEIENLPKFMESELVAIQGRGAVESSLEKITGQPVAGQEKLSFAVKREKNGVLYIGNTSFEELMASMLSGMLLGNPSGNGRFPDIAPQPEKLPAIELSPEQSNIMPKQDDAPQPDITAPKP